MTPPEEVVPGCLVGRGRGRRRGGERGEEDDAGGEGSEIRVGVGWVVGVLGKVVGWWEGVLAKASGALVKMTPTSNFCFSA
jgi:hypothetical protein